MSSTPYTIIIPARMNSTRLPGKMLLPLGNSTIIEQVVAQCCQSNAQGVIVATDHQGIASLFEGTKVRAVMTKESHPSGTDRLAEVAETLGLSDDDIIVNVQGDEPEIPVAVIEQLADALAESSASLATLVVPITDISLIQDPNVVKVVMNKNLEALYFSRSGIPFDRDQQVDLQKHPYYRHIGIYAYRVSALKQFATWDMGMLEQVEKLEQLRFLEHGHRIQTVKACEIPPVGIDTEADYQLALKNFG